MSTRWPLQPLSPPASNTFGANYTYATVASATDGIATMDNRIQDDTQGSGSVVSGLTSLENENEADDFDKMMIQAMRDDQRLKEAIHGKIQPFRKARAHPRVGLTMENLERNDAWNNGATSTNSYVKYERPESSNGSARSDPAIHAPPQWGRKARVDRNWLRRITAEEENQGTQDDTMNRFTSDNDATPRRANDADIARDSIETSPLSHKSPLQGTPASIRHDRFDDWDITMDLNEASLIASTPYIPRNTMLDDIRQREIESLKEQGVTTSRLDRIRETSQEEVRRPRSSSRPTSIQTNDTGSTTQQASEGAISPESRLRRRKNTWQSPGKSQATTGSGAENSPFVVYKKSSQTVGIVDPGLLANAQKTSSRPAHRREDSRDLLRHLARVSSTPSPGRTAGLRPQTAPAAPLESSSRIVATKPPSLSSSARELAADVPAQDSPVDAAATAPEFRHPPPEESHSLKPSLEPPQELQTADIDATPMPVERSMLNPKTPVVTGAWVDTPGPRTAPKPADEPPTRPQSSRKVNFDESIPEESLPTPPEEAPEVVPVTAIRPTLPGSALRSIVEKAKANQRSHLNDYGDSTINSLEELIAPLREHSDTGELDEDTLQGLELPTTQPRTEAERRRHDEVVHIHRMNDHLRATRTSLRDTNRGMSRVENRIEHVEETVKEAGEKEEKIIYRDCPCALNGHQYEFSLWRWFKSFFYDARLKAKREGSAWRFWGGLTTFGIFAVCFLTWWVSEEVACELYCMPMYSSYMPYPYAVNMNAPRYPFVIPTLIYRNLIKAWWRPLYGLLSWVLSAIYTLIFGVAEHKAIAAKAGGSAAATAASNAWAAHSEISEEIELDLSMMNDEIMRHR